MNTVARFRLITLVLLFLSAGTRAQDKDIPLQSSLQQNSEKWLIKMIN